MYERNEPNGSFPDDPTSHSPRGIWTGVAVAIGLLAILVGTAVVTSPASARGWFGRGGHGHGGGGHDAEQMREHALFATSWAMREIDATDAQNEAVEQIVSDTVDQLVDQGMHGELRERLVAELTGPTIDRHSLEALRSEQLVQIDELSRTLVDALAGISEVLTPEQRVELAELASHRRHGH